MIKINKFLVMPLLYILAIDLQNYLIIALLIVYSLKMIIDNLDTVSKE
jgi:hypothetical protein